MQEKKKMIQAMSRQEKLESDNCFLCTLFLFLFFFLERWGKKGLKVVLGTPGLRVAILDKSTFNKALLLDSLDEGRGWNSFLFIISSFSQENIYFNLFIHRWHYQIFTLDILGGYLFIYLVSVVKKKTSFSFS